MPIKYWSIRKLFFQLNGGHQTKKRNKVLGLSYLINEHPPWYICLLLGFQVLTIGLKEFCVFLFILYDLRESVSIEQIWNIVASRPKFVFSPTFIFCSPICSNNCGVVFLRKYILVFEKWLFSFDRSNMQIFTVNITRVVWPHVTNVLDLRYFCEHNPLFYLTVATSRRTMYIS